MRKHRATVIVWQAAVWPANLIVLVGRSRLAFPRLVRGSVPDQVMRQASCSVPAIPTANVTASTAPPNGTADHGTASAGVPGGPSSTLALSTRLAR